MAAYTVAKLSGVALVRPLGTPAFNFVYKKPLGSARDINYGGKGRVSGTVKVKGTPNYPVARRVRLYRDKEGVLVREQWSDPVTGAYSFDYVDETATYTVISYDYQHNFRAVVADNIAPEIIL